MRSAIDAATPRSWVTSEHRAPVLAAEPVEEEDDLGLDAHVERGGGLVGDEQARRAVGRPSRR